MWVEALAFTLVGGQSDAVYCGYRCVHMGCEHMKPAGGGESLESVGVRELKERTRRSCAWCGNTSRR